MDTPLPDDLDALLDSALEDFTKVDLGGSRSGATERVILGFLFFSKITCTRLVFLKIRRGAVAPLGPNVDPPLETGAELPSHGGEKKEKDPVKGLGGHGLPDLQKKKKIKSKDHAPVKDNHVAEALEQLTQETREAVRGLELDNAPEEEMIENLVKQFEEFAGAQDMETMVEGMMHQLLSKEILYEPMKEIGERYPKWLEQNKSVLSMEDYQRFSNQHELIKELNEVYENEPNNFNKIVDLMQKMQECGQPPNAIVQELAPDFDLASMGVQLSPELLGSTSNCCIM